MNESRRLRFGLCVHGTTIIELIIVVAILLIVTSLVVVKIAPGISARRAREGVRMFSTMLNAARNRALESGRPSGIWIERMADLPEAAMEVFYAEIPEPYSGDFADSKIESFIYPDYDTTNERYYINVVKPVSGGVRDRDLWYAPVSKIQQVIQPGDDLVVGCRRSRWALDTSENTRLAGDFSTPVWITAIGANAYDLWSAQNGKFSNEIQSNGRFVIRWFRQRGNHRGYLRTPGSKNPHLSQQEGVGTSYKIFRQPVRTASGGITLPEGTVIDLNYSGDKSWPMYVRYDAADKDSRGNRGNPFIGSATAPEVEDMNRRPIVIVFDEAGRVQRVWGPRWNSVLRTWSYGSYDPLTTLFFLIGFRENVPASWELTTAAQMENNWFAADAVWVALQTDNGLTNVGGNLGLRAMDAKTGQIAKLTATTRGFTYPYVANFWNIGRDTVRRRTTGALR